MSKMETIIFNDIKFYQIQDFPNYYVSKCGKVYSVHINKVKTPGFNKKGYLQLTVHRNNKQYTRKVHRLVAETFIPNPENKPQVNHKHPDGDKTRNTVENLEWATNKENINHAYDVLGVKHNFKGKALNARKINQYDKQGNFIKSWNCIKDIDEEIKLGASKNISAVCNGKLKSAYGFIWKYTE